MESFIGCPSLFCIIKSTHGRGKLFEESAHPDMDPARYLVLSLLACNTFASKIATFYVSVLFFCNRFLLFRYIEISDNG
jgi:hypothetical protein